MKKILSSFPVILMAVMVMWGGTALADPCPTPDRPLRLGESMCITVCSGMLTPVDIHVPALGSENPPVIIIEKGCAPGETSCDDPDCVPPSQWCFDMLFIDGPTWNHDWAGDSASWNILIGNFMCPGDTFCLCLTFDRILPVELTAFTAIAGDGEVRLNWTTASETNNDHWDIERATSAEGPWVRIHEEPGQGTVNTETNYVFVDRMVQNGATYWYRLTDVTINGERASHPIVSATPEDHMERVPSEFALKQNFPNPFNPTTTFEFAIAEPGFTTLKIYNLLGREIASVVEEFLEARLYQLTWGAGNLPSGIYLYTLTSGNFSDTRKLLLMK